MIYVVTRYGIYHVSVSQYLEYFVMDSPTGYNWDWIERFTTPYTARLRICPN
jgi:hypothetical protein